MPNVTYLIINGVLRSVFEFDCFVEISSLEKAAKLLFFGLVLVIIFGLLTFYFISEHFVHLYIRIVVFDLGCFALWIISL